MKYFKNTSWLFLERIFKMVLYYFIWIWLARYLGPKQFGLYNYVESFALLFTMTIATLGLEGVVIRELVKFKDKRDILLGTSFYLKLIGGIISLLIISISINFTSNDSYTNKLIFIVASAVLFHSFNVIDFYFQSKVLSKYIVYAKLLTIIISGFIKIILILLHAPLIAFCWVLLFDSIFISAGLIFYYLRHKLSLFKWKFDRYLAINLLRDSWPLTFSVLTYSIFSMIDKIMIKEIIDEYNVGIYSVAVIIYLIPTTFLLLLVQSIYPGLINTYNDNKNFFYEYYLKLSSYTTLIGYMGIAFIYFFSKNIIIILFGNIYADSGLVLFILSIGYISIANGFLRMYYLIITGNERLILYFYLISVTINIILNWVLIKKFGIIGAAYATVITYTLNLLFLNFIFKATRKIFFLQMRGLLLQGIWKKSNR